MAQLGFSLHAPTPRPLNATNHNHTSEKTLSALIHRNSPQFSPELLRLPIATNAAALDRIVIAKKRIQSVLDRDTAAHQKTLEQK